MSSNDDRTVEQALASLRDAAGELRTAVAARMAPSDDDSPAARRLKDDTARLGRAASDLLSTLRHELDQQDTAVGTAPERERAAHATTEIKSALGELARIASSVAGQVANVAGSSVKQADPEITKAIRALEDVADSAANWLRSELDAPGVRRGDRATRNAPPLDEL